MDGRRRLSHHQPVGIKERFTALDDGAYRVLSRARPIGWFMFASGVFLALAGLAMLVLDLHEGLRRLGALQLVVGILNAGVGLCMARRG